MNCPACKGDMFENDKLISSLKVHSCVSCGGNWLRFNEYTEWLVNSQDENEAPEEAELPISDSKHAKLCPDCGRILIKYKVHQNLEFYVEHCGSCNGIWLDKNEWETLKKYNLHRQMHNFFTEPWQAKLREDITREHLDKKYLEKFGKDDYEKLKSVKTWIFGCKSRDDMLAYLLDEDPYKI